MSFEALRDRLQSTATFLPDLPEETPDATVRALWLLAAGEAVSAAGRCGCARLPDALRPSSRRALAQLVEQRIAGVPLAHLTQRQRFLGLEMFCSADALVPRKETELLARARHRARSRPLPPSAGALPCSRRLHGQRQRGAGHRARGALQHRFLARISARALWRLPGAMRVS